MPMPPTTSETLAIAPEQQGHDARRGGRGLGDFLLVAHGKIVVAPGANVVPLAQQLDDLLLRRREIVRRGHLHIDARKVVPPMTRFIALV